MKNLNGGLFQWSIVSLFSDLIIHQFCFTALSRLGQLGYVNQVGLVSVCAKFQLSSLPRSGLKVPGGVVGFGVV